MCLKYPFTSVQKFTVRAYAVIIDRILNQIESQNFLQYFGLISLFQIPKIIFQSTVKMLCKIALFALVVAIANADYYGRRTDHRPFRRYEGDFLKQRGQLPGPIEFGERAVECVGHDECNGHHYCYNGNCV